MTSSGTTGSTGRLQLEAAPGGLCIVQDLLNSASMPVASVPDLLADQATAQSWLDATLRTWGERTGRTPPAITISGGDLVVLRELRASVRSWVMGTAEGEAGNDTAHPLDVDVRFEAGGLTYRPRGDGGGAVASLVHLEALLAAHTGTLRRLKTCLNPACGAAFYDLSRNGTRVWHDMRTCGNVMNLRASRARRRSPATPAGPATPNTPAGPATPDPPDPPDPPDNPIGPAGPATDRSAGRSAGRSTE